MNIVSRIVLAKKSITTGTSIHSLGTKILLECSFASTTVPSILACRAFLQSILRTLEEGYLQKENRHLICAVFDETFAIGESHDEVKKCALDNMLQGSERNALLPDSPVHAHSGVALLKNAHALRETFKEIFRLDERHLPQLSEIFKLRALKKWKEDSGIASSEVIVEELLSCIDLSRVDEELVLKCDFVPSSVIAQAEEKRRASKYVLVEGAPFKGGANGRYKWDGHCCYTKEARIKGRVTTFFIQKHTDNLWSIRRICGFKGTLVYLCSSQGTAGGDVTPSDGWYTTPRITGDRGPPQPLPNLQCRVIEPTLSA